MTVVVIINQDRESKRKKGVFQFSSSMMKCTAGSLSMGLGLSEEVRARHQFGIETYREVTLKHEFQ